MIQGRQKYNVFPTLKKYDEKTVRAFNDPAKMAKKFGSKQPYHDSYTDLPLTQLSIAYMNEQEDYIADRIAPAVSVNQRAGEIYEYGKELLRLDYTHRDVGGEYNEVRIEPSKSSFFYLKDRGLDAPVYMEDVEQAEDPLEPRQDVAEFLTQKMLLDREYTLASQLTQSNLGGKTLTGDDRWNQDGTDSTPFKDIQEGIDDIKDKSGKTPNILVLSRDTMSALRNHPQVIERIKYTGTPTDDTVREAIRDAFRLDDVLEGKTQAHDGGTGFNNVWHNKAILLYRERQPRLKSVSLAKTIEWNGWLNVQTFEAMNTMEGFKRKIDSIIRVEHMLDQVIMDSDCGYVIEGTGINA